MLYVGLDLSRKRIDFHAPREDGELVERGALPADPDGLARLVYRLGGHDREVLAVIESMNGARFVHDQLELAGFEVEIADAQRVKGLAPLACKTDRIDAWVLAELARRDQLQGRCHLRRAQARRGDLAHAQPQPTLCSGRRHAGSGRMTAHG